MKTADIAEFKGKIKNALLGWAEQQMDDLLPGRTTARGLLKNAARNAMARYGAKIDSGIDAITLLLGDAEGNLDSDTLIDTACSMLQEMPPTEYPLGPMVARMGKGEISIQFPRSFISEMFAGDLDGVKFTIGDIKEIKNYF